MGHKMTKTKFLTATAACAALAATAAATAQTHGAAKSGPATYWMSAETTSGLAAMNAGGQQAGRPSLLGAISGGRGAAPSAGHIRSLSLQLGSPRSAAGTPSAEHLPPSGLGAGPSLPLLSPERASPPVPPPHYNPAQASGAQGRILIYWGCGDRVRPGQPFEIDLARLSAGQMPPAMAQLAMQAMNPPNAASATTYGEWPNQRSRGDIPAQASLVGAHTIRGNYTPEINFTLGAGQDFLAPVRLTSNSAAAGGAVPVAWQNVPNARAWFMTATGAASDRDIVIWTSSEIQFTQMGAYDYIGESEIARLLQQRVLLPGATTQCTIPAEVVNRMQGSGSLMLNAFGPEANFSTPRPAGAARSWRPDWTVKLRTRSVYMGMIGQDLEAMMRGDRSEQRPDRPQREERRRRNPLNPLGRIFGG